MSRSSAYPAAHRYARTEWLSSAGEQYVVATSSAARHAAVTGISRSVSFMSRLLDIVITSSWRSAKRTLVSRFSGGRGSGCAWPRACRSHEALTSDDLVPQAHFATPEPIQILKENVQHTVLVLPRFSTGMWRDQHIAQVPQR